MSRTPKAPKPWRERREAWAVSGQFGERRELLGLGWFGWPSSDARHLWGNRIALFDARTKARLAVAALPNVARPHRVERVVVEVRPLPRTRGKVRNG